MVCCDVCARVISPRLVAFLKEGTEEWQVGSGITPAGGSTSSCLEMDTRDELHDLMMTRSSMSCALMILLVGVLIPRAGVSRIFEIATEEYSVIYSEVDCGLGSYCYDA